MTATPYRLYGQPVESFGDDTFIVTYPERISAETAERIKSEWSKHIKRPLVVLDGGARITRLPDVETTPIYDALVAEHGDPLGGAA